MSNKYKLLATTSDTLREHDGASFDNGLDDWKKKSKQKKIINQALEDNYQRGFQQGINSIREWMKKYGIDEIEDSQLSQFVDVAGNMRFSYRYDSRCSYNNFTEVFIDKAKNVL